MRRIVLIMTDTQPIDYVGCYIHGLASSGPASVGHVEGDPLIQTPSIDRLASQGVRFDRAYCCQPVCTPARAALFTGTYPHTAGAWANTMTLGSNIKTIGQRLRDQDLHTAYIGKWHLDGADYYGTGCCPDGWDPAYWYDMRCYLNELSPADRPRSRSFKMCLDDGFDASSTFANRCSNRAIDFLEKHHDQDFLLVVSYDEPHGPSLCPEPYNSMYRGRKLPLKANAFDTLEDKPPHIQRWAAHKRDKWEQAKKNSGTEPYARLGCNTFVDSEIGRVLDAVDRYAPDALVIYTSDHGESMFSHGITSKGAAMYDEITRIPFIVRWPGVAPAQGVCAAPVSHVDVVPTILEACGLSIPPSLEGRSLVASLRSPATAEAHPIFIEFNRFDINNDGNLGFMPMRCIFDGRYKLTLSLVSSDELYDLQLDPGEMKNLIHSPEHAALRDKLHEQLLDWMNNTRDPFRGYVWEQRPWRTDGMTKVGMIRPRPFDGYLPPELNYDTAQPMDGPVSAGMSAY